jgi:hypothetical protein
MCIKDELYTPSLKKDNLSKTKTYSLNGLFVVAAFFGILPLLYLGTENLYWLRVKKSKIYTVLIIGVLVLVGDIVGLNVYGVHLENKDQIRLSLRISGIVLYFVYYFAMKKEYKQHMILHGTTETWFKKALLIAIISAVVVAFVFILFNSSSITE